MAAFMKRLAENQVVDAASVGGSTAAELGSRAAFNSSPDLPNMSTTLVADIEAPASGVLIMNAAGNGSTVDLLGTCELLVDGNPVEGTEMWWHLAAPAPLHGACTTTGAIVVGPGQHTVTFDITLNNPADLLGGSVNVTWVPFDGTGATP
jgi:hypothetical protein